MEICAFSLCSGNICLQSLSQRSHIFLLSLHTQTRLPERAKNGLLPTWHWTIHIIQLYLEKVMSLSLSCFRHRLSKLLLQTVVCSTAHRSLCACQRQKHVASTAPLCSCACTLTLNNQLNDKAKRHGMTWPITSTTVRCLLAPCERCSWMGEWRRTILSH